jgi:N-methylhydantoinase B
MNAIELELMRLRLEAAAEEMGVVLQRTALSANIKERRDFSCALFDAQGRLIAQAAHVPVHLGSMPESVRAVLETLPSLAEGRTAIVNDPYAGGTHLPDITLVSPVYFQGRLIGYAANRAHHADVGGVTPGSMTLSRHIDEEGVRIPPSILDEATLSALLSAVRTPEERRGDLQAQELANAAGASALRRIAEAEGVEGLERGFAALLAYAERMTRDILSRIPAGTYPAEDCMDDDGTAARPSLVVPLAACPPVSGSTALGTGGQAASGTAGEREAAPVVIRLRLSATDGRLIADLTESDPQAAGCINCPAAVTRSAVYYVVGCLLRAFGHEGVPFNDGCFRPVEVITRPGTVVHAQYPAAVVAGNTETSQRVVDVVLSALRQALPELIPAESYGTMSSVALGARQETKRQRDEETKCAGSPDEPASTTPATSSLRLFVSSSLSAWTYYETIAGGSGAGPTWDGESGIQCHMTNTLNTPAEALEMQYPLRVRRFELREASGGPGTHRGGDGIVRELEALADCEGTLLTDRRIYPPGNGALGRNTVNDRDVGGKAHIVLRKGDVLRIETPGGSGWTPKGASDGT